MTTKISTQVAATMLGVQSATIRRYLKNGTLNGSIDKNTGRYYVSKKDVTNLAKETKPKTKKKAKAKAKSKAKSKAKAKPKSKPTKKSTTKRKATKKSITLKAVKSRDELMEMFLHDKKKPTKKETKPKTKIDKRDEAMKIFLVDRKGKVYTPASAAKALNKKDKRDESMSMFLVDTKNGGVYTPEIKPTLEKTTAKKSKSKRGRKPKSPKQDRKTVQVSRDDLMSMFLK